MNVVNGERSDVSSRYQIIECPYKQAEYRKTGMLYSRWPESPVWGLCFKETSPGVQKELMEWGWLYAILVEEDTSPITEDDGPAR